MIQSFNKVFYFIRIYDSLNFICTMSFLIVRELLPFLGFVTVVMFGIVKLNSVQHMSVNGEEYGRINNKFL